MTGGTQSEAAAVARQQVEWALAQGIALPDLFAAIHRIPPQGATTADAVAHYAEMWVELTERPPQKHRRLQQLQTERSPISPIAFAVCEEHDLLPQDVFSESRTRRIADARREIIARAKMLTRLSCLEIAACVGLDRSSVVRHLQAAERSGRLKAIRRACREVDQEAISGEPAERLWLLSRAVGNAADGRRRRGPDRASPQRVQEHGGKGA